MDADGLIRFEGRSDENGYTLVIKDNGRGMSSEDMNRITEAFYMADKSRARKRRRSGSWTFSLPPDRGTARRNDGI